MKISKIIFLSLLGTIVLIILVSAIYIKVQGFNSTTSKKVPDNFTFTKKVLSSFKVLSIKNSTNITLVQSDSSFIIIYNLKDSLAPVLSYTIDNDTLKIKDFMSQEANINYSGSLNDIQLKNSSVFIESLSAKKMAIEMDSSSVTANERSKESEIGVLNIFGKNKSDFQIRTGKFKIDSLNIVLQNSKAYLYSNENRLNCDISNKSNVRLTEQPLEIVMKKDSTSQFSVRETQTIYRR